MKLAYTLPLLVILTSCSNSGKQPNIEIEKFSDYKVNDNYTVGNWWHYAKRESELKKLSGNDFKNYFQQFASEIDTTSDTYYFLSVEKQDKDGSVLTFLRGYESCCIDLMQVNYDPNFKLTGKGVMASWGGDGGWGFHEVGKYINDSTYQKIWVEEETTIDTQDSSVYSIDSTIWTYKIGKNLNMEKINTEKHTFERVRKNNPS